MEQLKKTDNIEHRYIDILLGILIFLSFIGLTGCSSTEIMEDRQESVDSKNAAIEDYSSEIDEWGTDTTVIGTVNHGIRSEEIKELEVNGYLIYDGGELKVPYKASATGKATNLGFLLFVDGRPQAYHTNEFEEDTYCHVFQMEEDVENYFSFYLLPCVGKEGETLKLSILSIYYPDFMPDMKQTSSYGMYHQTLEVACNIKMEANSPAYTEQMATDNMVNDIVVNETEITQDYLLGPITMQYGMQEITQESLDNNIFNVVLFDGKYYTDNFGLSSDVITITFEMCGKDGTEYYVTPFIDHVPVSSAQLVTARKGKVSSLTCSMDVTALDDFSTFYFIAIPMNNDNFMQIKTSSILLYKEETAQ